MMKENVMLAPHFYHFEKGFVDAKKHYIFFCIEDELLLFFVRLNKPFAYGWKVAFY